MYNYSPSKASSVLNVWEFIEILLPRENQTIKNYFEIAAKKYEQNKKKFVAATEGYKSKEVVYFLQNLPHEEAKKDKKIHCWHAYIGYMNWSAAETKIKKKMAELFPELRDPLDKDRASKSNMMTPIAGFVMDHNGKLDVNSIEISSGVWAFGKIMQPDFIGEDLEQLLELDKGTESIRAEIMRSCKYEEREGEQPGIYMTLDTMQKIIPIIMDKLKVDQSLLMGIPDICIKNGGRMNNKTEDDNAEDLEAEGEVQVEDEVEDNSKVVIPPLETLNSFFLQDIRLVKDNIDTLNSKSAIFKYLGMANEPDSKDVLDDRSIFKDLLSPAATQASRWPSPPQHPLTALQAGAINAIFRHKEDEPLFAVNGPPGKGKTTMMFDLIANIYVKRAKALSNFKDPKKAFERNEYIAQTDKFTYYLGLLDDSLKGHGIVVASSNNNAVENISKELPLRKKIDKLYQDDLSYFPWFGKGITTDKKKKFVSNSKQDENDPTWGLFSAVLGNHKNKSDFTKDFWKQEPYDKSEHTTPPLYTVLTMLQYLSVIKGDDSRAKDFEKYKPSYCSSVGGIQTEWTKHVNEFNYINKLIENIEIGIDTVLDVMIKNDEPSFEIYYNKLQTSISNYEKELETLETEERDINTKLKQLGNKIIIHKKHKPLFFNILHKPLCTKAYYKYTDELKGLEESEIYLNDSLQLKSAAGIALKKKKEIIDIDLKSANLTMEKIKEAISYLRLEESDIYQFPDPYYWKKSDADIQMTIPRYNKLLEILKSQLFVKAVKLHEVFIHANAKTLWSSLNFFADSLKNKVAGDREMLKEAWEHFFMVVPVVSTTFHSFARMFYFYESEEIPWLIIDEAGQAPPQNAVGAIYRSKNVVVIGDQMQTEPVVPLAEGLIKKFFGKYGLEPEHWAPADVSVQSIADRNSLYQTKLNKKVTVGFPLLVHRRCQEPMFSISNQIAYNNKMVYAVNNDDSVITPILGPSCWIDVVDKDPTNGYSSKAEIQALVKKLNKVLSMYNGVELLKKIYVITFYKSFRQDIKDKLPKMLNYPKFKNQIYDFCNNNIGTVHTFQGKENDAVIMLLGAQEKGNEGARTIMVKKPNVLNVAISRAKKNIYIIGNQSVWRNYESMDTVYTQLTNQKNKFPAEQPKEHKEKKLLEDA